MRSIIKENEKNIINLLKYSWKENKNKKSGGFCIGKFEKEPPTVVTTQQVLTLLKLLNVIKENDSPNKLDDKLYDVIGIRNTVPKIHKFLEECKTQENFNGELGYGYGFTNKGGRKFTPSVFSTSHAIDILLFTSQNNY